MLGYLLLQIKCAACVWVPRHLTLLGSLQHVSGPGSWQPMAQMMSPQAGGIMRSSGMGLGKDSMSPSSTESSHYTARPTQMPMSDSRQVHSMRLLTLAASTLPSSSQIAYMSGLLALEGIRVGESLTGGLVLQEEEFLMSLSTPQNRGPTVQQQQRFPYPSMMGHEELGGMPRMAARAPYEDEMRVRFAPSKPLLQSPVLAEQIRQQLTFSGTCQSACSSLCFGRAWISVTPVGKRPSMSSGC